jgi:hypothetical protein
LVFAVFSAAENAMVCHFIFGSLPVSLVAAMTNNRWPGKPGVPLNPETRGAHQVGRYIMIWRPWRRDYVNHNGRAVPPELAGLLLYQGPCLTPAEVEARIADAHKEWLAELNHDTDALMEAARQSALAECIAACDAVIRLYRVELPEKYKFKPEGIPFEWEKTWEEWAEIAEDIAAAIRALSDTPPGMVLVPREPTDAMIKACLQAAMDFMAETKTTEVHPAQTYPSPSENARRCWRAMVKAAAEGKGNE